ncbi:hypothetical protein FA95DRAFT_121135 [Auriscalpium vulgare]|uniref:Uncharacterized protein n=1 Tax=Auriscalpium vulgare TaxID=40419 RepID=A0ACB8RMY1_9AGAM|nr:hypothetical protein FA95DRAFT_121135 [Auriscalpium vulgare]
MTVQDDLMPRRSISHVDNLPQLPESYKLVARPVKDAYAPMDCSDDAFGPSHPPASIVPSKTLGSMGPPVPTFGDATAYIESHQSRLHRKPELELRIPSPPDGSRLPLKRKTNKQPVAFRVIPQETGIGADKDTDHPSSVDVSPPRKKDKQRAVEDQRQRRHDIKSYVAQLRELMAVDPTLSERSTMAAAVEDMACLHRRCLELEDALETQQQELEEFQAACYEMEDDVNLITMDVNRIKAAYIALLRERRMSGA